MRLRQTRRARFLYLDDALVGEDRTTMELVDHGRGPESELGSKELAGLLKNEIRRIPPLLRTVFVLRDVDELPMPQVAERLGISVAAAKSRLLRARLELRVALREALRPAWARYADCVMRLVYWVRTVALSSNG